MKLANLKSTLLRVVVVAGAVGLATQIFRVACGPSPMLARAEDRKVADTVLSPGSDRRADPPNGAFVSGTAIVEPRDGIVRVAGDASGRVVEVLVRAGQRVTAGEALVRLEQSGAKARVAAAEAELAGARADLAAAGSGRSEDVEAAQSELEAARARAALSQDGADRALKLGGTLSEAERLRQTLAAQADAAAARSAASRLQATRTGARPELRASVAARVKGAQARLEQAQSDLRGLTIFSPRDGDVLEVLVKPGERYDPQSGGAVLLGDQRSMVVRMEVDERAIGFVRVGARATVRSPSYPQQDIEAVVVELGQKMGRKKLRGDDPSDPVDVRVREVLLSVPDPRLLVVGQRVDAYVAR
jgi:HlyD family secretion protein